MGEKKLNRRSFVRGAAAVGTAAALGALVYARRSLAQLVQGNPADIDRAVRDHKEGLISDVDAQATVAAYMTAAPGPPRVVHVHDPGATSWDFGSQYYGHYVDQGAVDSMVDQGVMALTGTAAVATAWSRLVPDYQAGKAIAVKVNFNNCWVCSPTHLNLNNTIHTINAIVRGLKMAYSDLDESDVWVYEAAQVPVYEWGRREIASRFVDGCLYPGVRFFDYSCNDAAEYDNTDPTALIDWNPPSGTPDPPTTRLTDVLVGATYLIDIPLMKRHWSAGITGALKNHMGSIADPWELHPWMYPSGQYYQGTTWNPIVDIWRNTHIADKTRLILLDGLFGNWECNNSKAKPWSTFGNSAPDSLFLATDPVAIDSVMADFLDAENPLSSTARDVLVYADHAGLGVHEEGDPWGSGYSLIDYVKIVL